MSVSLRAAVVTDPGLIRTNNEDSAYAGRRLLVVADGVGGLPAGELASEIAVQELATLDTGQERTGPGEPAGVEPAQADGPAAAADPLAAMRAAIETASQRIRQAAEADPATEGMGTTVTALMFYGDQHDQIAVLHVGDSRAYLLRGGALSQLTRDDTFVQELVDQGVLTAEEARRHPQRSLITKAVQGQPVKPTGALLTAEARDRYLLCSDGLSDIVAEAAIGAALQSYPEPRQCAEQLVKLALQAGAPDNVTVIVADVDAG